MKSIKFTEEEIYDLIATIPDPEIPVITIKDLGILRSVKIENEKVIVSITPTYSGCPAMMAIEKDIKSILIQEGIETVEVKTVYSPVWTTDWLTDEAKEKLRKYGISPPGKTSIDKGDILGVKIAFRDVRVRIQKKFLNLDQQHAKLFTNAKTVWNRLIILNVISKSNHFPIKFGFLFSRNAFTPSL